MFLTISTTGIIANVIGGIAMTIFLISSTIKKKRFIIILQTIAHVILAVSEALLNTFSSIVQEVISITRNVSVLTNKNTKWFNVLLIILGLVVGITFNIIFDNNNWIGYLPIIANFEYSIFLMKKNVSVNTLKLSLAFSSLLWCIFFLMSQNYLSGIFNALTVTMALVTVSRNIFQSKKEAKLKDNVEK